MPFTQYIGEYGTMGMPIKMHIKKAEYLDALRNTLELLAEDSS